jgi:thiamine biosynthesis lipoprotein
MSLDLHIERDAARDAGLPGRPRRAWRPIAHPLKELAIRERPALGTTVRLVTAPGAVTEATTLADTYLDELDKVASRFRPDSEVCALARAGAGVFFISPLLAELLEHALEAWRYSDGLLDPTLGGALIAAGYDRDFAAIGGSGPAPVSFEDGALCTGVDAFDLHGRLLEIERPILFDLGSSAKAHAADVLAARLSLLGAAVLVSLGGDLASRGTPPGGAWPLLIDEMSPGATAPVQLLLREGGLATSSTLRRRWNAAGKPAHHLLDPRTALPASGPWRTASVVAASCVRANAASSAAIIAGEGASRFLELRALSARLVGTDGSVHLVGDWPTRAEGLLEPQRTSGRRP